MIMIKLNEGESVQLKNRLPEFKVQAEKVGITITDDMHFYGKGLAGWFAIKPNYVEVHVDDKPWGTFEWMIKEKLESLIGDALDEG